MASVASERKAQPPKERSAAENNAAVAEGVGDTMASAAPEWAKPYAAKLGAVLAFLSRAADAAAPYAVKAVELGQRGYEIIEPYGPKELAPMAVGILMCLLGGYFMILISCIEAYRMSGWEQSRDHILVMWANITRAREESKADDKVDADNDGVADVRQITKKELAARKITLFMRVTDPVELSQAVTGIYCGFVAVLATLKMQLARTIALGVAIGEVVYKPVRSMTRPIAVGAVPAEYHNWIDVVIGYVCKGFGVWIAMLVHRVLAAVHSAMRGAQLFCDAFARYTRKRGHTSLADGYYDEVAVGIVAFFGLYMQVSSGFVMPWLLAIPLSPLLAIEAALASLVTYTAM